MENWEQFLKANSENLYRTHQELCLIPAPSHFEDARAEYCKKWLEQNGAVGTYIDEAKNVIFPLNCDGSNQITVVNAHTDTVFPIETPLDYTDDGEIIRCPGVGDDTGCLTVMLYAVKFFLEQGYRPKNGILFVCNSCEEGLGNLYGIRQIYKDFAGRIAQQISVDADYNEIFNSCVGSHRYEVTVLTQGGHSYSNFGNKNAIAEASKIISRIYELKVPEKAGTKTTYNVGTVSGGTSVNTIAQKATFLCEYRSDDTDCMDLMKTAFERIFSEAQTDGVRLEIALVGERPCAKGVEQTKMDTLSNRCSQVIQKAVGQPPREEPASTDCNVPLSLGVPALCIGAMLSGGTHTTEEWLKKDSLLKGFEIVVKVLSQIDHLPDQI